MAEYRFTERDREVVRQLAQHDLSMAGAARAMYIHVGTVQYYAAKIEGKTGLSPLKFYDMIELLKLVEEQEALDGT